MQRTKTNEASLINDAVLPKVGRWTLRGGTWVDGKAAVLEMKEADFGSWREIEWPGYYIKFAVQDAIQSGFLGGFRSIVDRKHYLAKGEYLWDARLMNVEYTEVMLADKARTDQLIQDNDGIGLVVFQAEVVKEYSGEFRAWHIELGGGKTQWIRDSIARGALPKVRKTEFMVTHSIAFHFDSSDFEQGLDEGWLTLYAHNMRNARGELRNPKYMLHLDHVPMDKLLGVRCFNSDPEEFEEFYSDLPPC